MGKGDRRSKRGKIFRGTYGKRRPKPAEDRKKAKAAEAAAAVSLERTRGAMPPSLLPVVRTISVA